MDFEICIDSVEGGIAASKFGAKRVELCSALELGGLTPSAGMTKEVVTKTDSGVYVMIRPRAGGFIYSGSELNSMLIDIRTAADNGATGVVFGVLDSSNKIDIKTNSILMEEVFRLKLNATFHRAIDLVDDPLNALEDIIHLGFERILTSGGKTRAIDGIERIKQFVQKGKGRIEIMAGSGVNSGNALELANIGIDALHFTAHKPIDQSASIDFGIEYEVDEQKINQIMAHFK